jgi:hypothetical protein
MRTKDSAVQRGSVLVLSGTLYNLQCDMMGNYAANTSFPSHELLGGRVCNLRSADRCCVYNISKSSITYTKRYT